MENYKHFYVFTGSRPGQKKFPIGNITMVRNTLKKSGISIVDDVNKADAVIVPDGATSSVGLPIFTWNDFVQFNRKNKMKPTKPVLSSVDGARVILDNVVSRDVDYVTLDSKIQFDPIFDFSILETSLKNIETNDNLVPHNVNSAHGRSPNKNTQPEVKILESNTTPQLYTYTTRNTIDIGFGIECMNKLVQVTDYFLQPVKYVMDLYSAMRVFYQQLDQLFKIVLKFWGELRGNLSLQYNLPPVKNIQNFDASQINATWIHFKQNFNRMAIEEMCHFFSVPLSTQSMKYFEEIEHDLIYMQYSVFYKSDKLNQEFEIWANETRRKFRRCELLSESDCTHCCVFQKHSVKGVSNDDDGGVCKDKPFLVALDDIIKSVCSDNSNENDEYIDNLQFLQTSLMEIFVNLFGIPYHSKESICFQIIYMFDTIKVSLESMIGKSIRWSQAADFMNISSKTWNNLWLGTDKEKQSSLEVLSDMQEDPVFVQTTKNLVIALSQIMQ
jgi:hypothetical protein